MVPAAAACRCWGSRRRRRAEREELFTAWRRFLEQVADERPTVLVFEDLHWADEAMLAFLEHLADLAEGVPLLLVGTARPELYERHPDYAAGLRNATPINLAPLSQEETARLVSALLDATVLPVELQQPILDRAGGNPLYAEEFVRLLKDRDLLVRAGASWELQEGAEVPFPDSVQALIAARLDTLEPEAKSLLADAAVIGKVFWAGGVAAMGERDPQAVTGMLRELSRKELVRPARQSSMEGRPSTRSGTSSPATSPTTSSRAPRAPPATSPQPAGSSRRPPTGSRTWPTCSPTTTPPLSSSPARPDRPTRRRAGSARAAVPRPRRRARARPGHRRRPRELRACARARPAPGTPTGPWRSPGSARPPSTPGASPTPQRRWRRRSRPSGSEVTGRAAARAMGTLGEVLCRTRRSAVVGRCRPRRWPSSSRCPRPELVGALTDLARAEALQGKTEAGRPARRAGARARRASSASPARARTLGFRGLARCDLGDRAGSRRLPGGDRARHRGRAGARGGACCTTTSG